MMLYDEIVIERSAEELAFIMRDPLMKYFDDRMGFPGDRDGSEADDDE